MIFLGGGKEKRGLVKGKQGSVQTAPHVQLLWGAKSISDKSRNENTISCYRTVLTRIRERCAMSLELPPLVRSGIFLFFSPPFFAVFSAPSPR